MLIIGEDLSNFQSGSGGRKRKGDPLSFLPTLPAVSITHLIRSPIHLTMITANNVPTLCSIALSHHGRAFSHHSDTSPSQWEGLRDLPLLPWQQEEWLHRTPMHYQRWLHSTKPVMISKQTLFEYISHAHCSSPLSCSSCLDPSPKRTRSRSWDPNTVLQSKRRVRPLTQAGRGHQRAQTMTVQQRKGREEFRKALVNLIM